MFLLFLLLLFIPRKAEPKVIVVLELRSIKSTKSFNGLSAFYMKRDVSTYIKIFTDIILMNLSLKTLLSFGNKVVSNFFGREVGFRREFKNYNIFYNKTRSFSGTSFILDELGFRKRLGRCAVEKHRKFNTLTKELEYPKGNIDNFKPNLSSWFFNRVCRW